MPAWSLARWRLWHPGAIAPGFGAGSLARHRRRAGAAGLRFGLVCRAVLTADVDMPADLALLAPPTPVAWAVAGGAP